MEQEYPRRFSDADSQFCWLAPRCRCEVGLNTKANFGVHRYGSAVNIYALTHIRANALHRTRVGSSRVDLQACKLEYSIVSPK